MNDLVDIRQVTRLKPNHKTAKMSRAAHYAGKEIHINDAIKFVFRRFSLVLLRQG